MSDILDYNFAFEEDFYNFAFEVDLEKMEGKYLFNTGEKDHDAAEKKILEYCDYKYPVFTCTLKSEHKPLIFDSQKVLGLTYEELYLPMGETSTTILATEKGFICQLSPGFWVKPPYRGEIIFVVTLGKYYPIMVINSFFDI